MQNNFKNTPPANLLMDIISIHYGHNATVGLMREGKLVALVSEERFAYEKNRSGFPHQSLKWIKEKFNVDLSESLVVLAGKEIYNVLPSGTFNYIKHRSLFWYITYLFPSIYPILRPLIRHKLSIQHAKRKLHLKKLLKEQYGIENVLFVEHHACHAYTPLWFIDKKKDFSVITLDGGGDGLSGSVWKWNGKMERIETIDVKDSIGVMYSIVTQFLGMKALEHEYKVMGLAPYAKRKYAEKTYEKYFKSLIRVDGLKVKAKFPTSRFSYYLREHLCGERFDNIAYGIQKLTEEVILKLVRNVVDALSIPNIATSGGVFMNVKANMLIAYMNLNDVFFTPSAGDESNPIGAAYYAYMHHLKGNLNKIKPIKELYLGPSFSNDEIEEFIKKKELKRKYKVSYYKDIEGVIAELIAKGEVVARFAGRAEWGARALGNRSILADPSKMESFFKVNDQIKMRDFWMPFAPTMLKERADEYIENPYKRKAPYMILAFKSTEEGRKYFRAAMHQADKTLRPQILERSWNPEYYKIIKEFENITGIGGVLNTSFNLHGKPIATFPWQALDVFENSKLKYLAIENWLIEKKN